ncbi:2-dehydropantoate 2-reductase [Rhizomicrobium palustre]|uniref:2-dehydropantoate 2-reductase n=1 Tax=Rhizomicrobium palustre TaxID=189966 RepID=A0A846N3G1_9PROT|nr:2-dehydropantoate 2-reductase [Rhizomicrobium palustre]NIK90049.1 2-dehydropantoate 2-reductase [Rhizomicrobium palustre]
MARISLIGPGAIGSAVGGALLDAGHEVTFCARKAFTRLSVRKEDERPKMHLVNVVTAPEDLSEADWVLVCVKTYQVPGVADWLKAAVTPGAKVAVLQNGIEQRENVEPFVPEGTEIVPVIIDLPASRKAPGEVVWKRIAQAFVPEGEAGKAFVALFEGSFLTAETTEDFVTRGWLKLCNNAPSGAVLALTGLPLGVMHSPGVAEVARAILTECIAVGRADGAKLDDELIERQMQAFLSAPAQEGNSMYEDRMAGRPMEWSARNAVILRKGEKHGIATPVSAVVVPLLQAISEAKA